MPELPEVENVVRSIGTDFKFPLVINKFQFLRKDLRWSFPQAQLRALEGQSILKLHRRAKYILFTTKDFTIISHLGMTGQWITSPLKPQLKKHDHLVVEFAKKSLVYNDPRRFGFVQVVANNKIEKYFSAVGVEPFAELSVETLQKIKKSDRAIKNVLMDQKIVVGIGNIYASEALFRAKIKPQTLARLLSVNRIKQLYHFADEILAEAIAAGGSSISNYLNAQKQKGAFQQRHLVYDREGEPCKICGTEISRLVQIGRSTFWCKTCQK